MFSGEKKALPFIWPGSFYPSQPYSTVFYLCVNSHVIDLKDCKCSVSCGICSHLITLIHKFNSSAPYYELLSLPYSPKYAEVCTSMFHKQLCLAEVTWD